MVVYQAQVQGQGGIPDQQVNVADDRRPAQKVKRQAKVKKLDHRSGHCCICETSHIYVNVLKHVANHHS